MAFKKIFSGVLCCFLLCTLLSGCGEVETQYIVEATDGPGSSVPVESEPPVDIPVQQEPAEPDEPAQPASPSAPADNTAISLGKKIDPQSFDVNLEPLGEVSFVSYEPDFSTDPMASVVFQIEKNGEVLSQLPVSQGAVFKEVAAVSFLDFNYDGFDDIITIISYYVNGQCVDSYSIVCYFTGSENGSFSYAEEMSKNASSALAVFTIQSAKDFIGYK